MAHKLPKYRFRNDEPIAAEEIAANHRTVKDELSKLNEHNFASNAFPDRTYAAPGFTLHLNNDFVEFDAAVGYTQMDGGTDGFVPGDTSYPRDYAASGGAPPGSFDDTRFTLSGHSEWQSIMQLEKFTGNSLLWVLASFQQQSFRDPDDPCGQYAIRIDGTVVDETITGGLDRSNDPYGESVNSIALPFVTDLILPLAAGNHIIELVGRVPQSGSLLQLDDVSTVAVFNRELILLVLDPESTAVDGTGSEVTLVEEGYTIDAATMQQGYDDIKDDINDIEFPDIQPESLTAEHCPTAVENARSVSISGTVAHTYTNKYTYYGDSTIGSPGWQLVDDGTHSLFLDTISTIDMTDSSLVGILVGTDVNVVSLVSAGPDVAALHHQYAIFTIMFRDENGDWHNIKKTERYLNSEWDTTEFTLDLHKTVSIRTVITADDIAPHTNVTGIMVAVATDDRSINNDVVTATLRDGNLWYAALQGE